MAGDVIDLIAPRDFEMKESGAGCAYWQTWRLMKIE
jgi:hypothetical protein